MKFSQKTLPYKVLKFIRENRLVFSNEKIIVAVSGGPDSMCLLDVFCKIKDDLKIELAVCHFNHRLRGEESYNDEELVEKECKNRGLECFVGRAPKKDLYKNEEEARDARYGFFKKILKEGRGSKIALAHNCNDSAETMLLRLVRGCGLLGLRGIPRERKKFIRPLLPFDRSEIVEYLSQEKIKYCVDKTNQDIKIGRNFIRLEILPRLQTLNPSVIKTLCDTSSLIEEDYDFIMTEAEKYYQKILIGENEKSIVLDRKKILDCHPSLQKSIIRLSITKISSLLDISNKQIQEVCQMIHKGEGKKFKLLPHSLRVALEDGNITILVQ